MRIVIFAHSIISDWNNGNAHFLRGVVTELKKRGIAVSIYEPEDSWSLMNMVADVGEQAVQAFHENFPHLSIIRYKRNELDLDQALDKADLVIVHEWNDPDLVRSIGRHHHVNTGYKLLYHDTHHRAISDPRNMELCGLSEYDGILAFGEVLKSVYESNGWSKRVWVWHEAADTSVFHPVDNVEKMGDVVWIGNWGDEERSRELHEFLFDPVRQLSLRCRVHGVRYPSSTLDILNKTGIEFAGWLPNYKVPEIFARFHCTVHIPRQQYAATLKGIPTIRPFEALACGIPLICSPWDDTEHLFTPGEDFLIAKNGDEMKEHIYNIKNDASLADALITHGLQTIMKRHTCAHRVNELLSICQEIGVRMSDASQKCVLPHSGGGR